jgi:hypothetical protein
MQPIQIEAGSHKDDKPGKGKGRQEDAVENQPTRTSPELAKLRESVPDSTRVKKQT